MLKKRILNRELTVGSWISLADTGVAEILAKAGFDWLVVDLEHSTISINQAGELIRTIDLAGVPPLVRLTSNDTNQIKRVLDAGAVGIIVPMVNSVSDAEIAVAATRYGPAGHRGVGLARAQGYGVEFGSYFERQSNKDDGPIVIVQIEHIEAVHDLEKILGVPNVDGFIVGPYDLSCSMGIPGDFEHPEFIKTLKTINCVRDKLKICGGLHVVEPSLKELNSAIDHGYKFIAYSVDIRMLDTCARSAVNALNKGDAQ